MKYLSVCSGIEAATVAWHPLGWTPVAFAEIDRFASRVLAHHYPHVPNLGDMTAIDTDAVGAIDLLVGGTPCQPFSVAGIRGGMADPRGNLALVYLRLADRLRPRWLVWENVPGVLSSAGGRDFGSFLGGLAQLGYGFAYRVLDAQFFGLAQRRKRVFIVGCLGDWRGPASVLLERSGLCWDPPPRRGAREGVAGGAAESAGGCYGIRSDAQRDGVARTPSADAEGRVRLRNPGLGVYAELSPTLDASAPHSVALCGEGFDASEDGTGRGIPLASFGLNGHSPRFDGESETLVAFNARQDPDVSGDVTDSLGAKDTGHGVLAHHAVRRLTPLECERLQGFQDGYTAIPGAKDGPRYRALGNSMAVPVMRWIGQRIGRICA